MYNEFITPETLTTFTGLVVAVSIVVQFTKSIIKRQFGDSAVRLYAFIIALALSFIFVKSESGVKGIILIVINAILISMTSMGAYETITDPRATKEKPGKSKKLKIK